MAEENKSMLPEEEQQVTITLTLDDDSDLECEVITLFEATNGNSYIALLPLDEKNEDGAAEVLLYRYSSDENGTPNLDNIETDEEYDIAAESFYSAMEAMEDSEDSEEQ